MIGAYIETLEPDVGKIWHGDEMKIKIKGEWKWLWNMMDEKTRFQLVSMIAETREGEDAKKTFQQSKKVTSKRPNLVVTDGLAGYKKAFNQEFYDHHQTTKHIADVALQSGLNNSIERMHGSIQRKRKGHEGNQRAWKLQYSQETRSTITLFDLIPLWMEKHLLKRAGIGIDGENKWMELLRGSLKGR